MAGQTDPKQKTKQVWPQITVGINIAKRPIMISTVQVNPPVE